MSNNLLGLYEPHNNVIKYKKTVSDENSPGSNFWKFYDLLSHYSR